MSHNTRIKTYISDYLCPEQEVSFHSVVNRLAFLWRKIGFSEGEVFERFNNVLNRYETLNNDLLQANEAMVNNLSHDIKQFELELQQLCSELEIEAEEVNLNLPLLQKKKCILAQLEDLKQIKHSRIEQHKKLREEQDALCNFLKMPKVFEGSSAIPKVRRLNALEAYTKKLSDVKKQRISAYHVYKERLSKLSDESGFVIGNSIELDVKHVLTELSQEKLDHMKEIVEKGRQFQQRIAEEIHKLTKIMINLWDDLNKDDRCRKDFINTHVEIRQSTIDVMETEIKSCEQQVMKRDISNLKKQLVELWDNCLIRNKEREEFESFHSQKYNMSALQAHLAEVERLKKYYESTKAIYQKITKRQELWETVVTFEKLSRDPSRFINRGGTLLREEKQRNTLMKELQRLDDEIIRDVEEYKEKNCIPVLVSGIDYRTFIKKKWEQQQMAQKKKQTKGSPAQQTPRDKLFIRNPASAPAKLTSTKPFERIPSSDKLTSSKPIASIPPSDKFMFSPISSRKNVAFPTICHGDIRKKTPPALH